MRRLAFARSCGLAVALAATAAGPAPAAAPRPVSAGVSSRAPQAVPSSPQAAAGTSAVTFDVVVTDREGRVPDSLGLADVAVSVDGKARRVLSIRRVSRGPGALSDASARQARSSGVGFFAAEPARNVLVVVDQDGLVRGEERAAITAGRAFLDRLGVADRMAVLHLPLAEDQLLSLATDQPAAREALAGIAGRILPSLPTRTEEPPIEPARAAAGDPGGERPADSVAVSRAAPPAAIDMTASGSRANLEGLADVLQGMRSVPGRKVVALFSAGVIGPSPAQMASLATGAVAARTAVYAFGLAGPRDAAQVNPEFGPLETLAASTGGTSISLGRNPERAIGRVVSELAACYVVEVEGSAADADGRRHALRVDMANRSWIVRAPAWLVPTGDTGDVLPAGPEPAPGADASAVPAPEDARPARAPARTSEREAELELAMGRLTDYVESYERQYSGLVAEEDYKQSTRGKQVHLRADFLLVRPEHSDEWTSFRDVFEVDGVAVRDREDRLKRLFLDPGAQAQAQLMSIKDESARFNIGTVERNVNVPLFTLLFLRPENRARFRFRFAGDHRSAGIDVWRVDYEEQTRPTIITDGANGDMPAKGWFLVDQTTGAIVESGLHVEQQGYVAEIVVSFRHDPALGMWVPAEMTESYRTAVQRTLTGMPRMEPVIEGTASYTKFRRFQVKTEEKITIPK